MANDLLLERTVLGKVTVRLLPFLGLLYFVNTPAEIASLDVNRSAQGAGPIAEQERHSVAVLPSFVRSQALA